MDGIFIIKFSVFDYTKYIRLNFALFTRHFHHYFLSKTLYLLKTTVFLYTRYKQQNSHAKEETNMQPTSPTDLIKSLRKNNLSPNKRLGQNFLIDNNVVQNIADSALSGDTKNILEIGPGAGAMSLYLAKHADKLALIEIDSGMVKLLQELLATYENVQIMHEDVLESDLEALQKTFFEGQKYSVCANLPYYISTPIIMSLLKQKDCIDDIVIMVQEEVADRMSAKPGTKAYGSLTIAISLYAKVEKLFNVPPTCFYPQPKINSSVIRISLLDKPEFQIDERYFDKAVRCCFAMRRKTILNNLTNGPFQLDRESATAVLEAAGIDPKLRAEALPPQKFADLSIVLGKTI